MFGNLPLSDFLEYLGWNVVYGRENCTRIGPHISVTDDNNDNRQVCFNRVDIYTLHEIRCYDKKHKQEIHRIKKLGYAMFNNTLESDFFGFRCQLFYYDYDYPDYYDYDY